MTWRISALALLMGSALGVQMTRADTIVVSPTGSYRSVAAAVRAAPAGSRIVVEAGTYREPSIVIDKPLELVGEGRPVLEGRDPSTLIRVVADDVAVRGLVLAHVPPSNLEERAALKFEGAHRCVAEALEIRDAPFGIYAAEAADCHIANNVVRGSGSLGTAGNAIHLWSSSRMTVRDNVVSGHRDGLYFEFVRDTSIEGNLSEANLRYGMHFMFSHGCTYRDNHFVRNGAGVAVMYTHGVTIERNEFRANRGPAAYGLLLKDISESRIDGNRFDDNTVGLLIEGGGHLTIRGNSFTRNGWALKLMANSPFNRVEQNVFAGNSFDVGTNSRSTVATVVGNWWDRYRGYDLDRDGRGDVPFRPVRLFSLLVANQPGSVILMRSLFVDLLDAAESALPVLTPDALADTAPAMAVPR
ncbi:MAG TPA: nitrous oxide reductase family maturation protein NosD [Vicinamibacterales bacterium]